MMIDKCLYEGQKTSRKRRIELSTKVRQERGRQTRGLYSLELRPSTRQSAFYAWAMGWDS